MAAAALVVMLSCAACGSSSSPSPAAQAPSAQPSHVPGTHAHHRSKGSSHTRHKRSAPPRSASSTGTGTGSAHDSTHNPKSGGSNGGPSSAAPAFPEAGTYVYSQSGTEEFCAGAKCDREKLPPTERQVSKITGRSNGTTTIVTEVRSTDGRYVRTTIDYSNDVAAITEVYYSFSYDGFSFSDDYKPDPPVRSVLFPLSVGRSWSGSWDAKTSGTYSMKVASVDDVDVAGSSARAFRLDTSEHFSGEYKGTAAITVWIDPATKAVVKTSGALRLSNSLGSYDTNFTTQLQQGPGYS